MTLHFQPGIWAGVELLNPVGLHSGIVDNTEYFCCKPLHGVLAPLWTLENVQSTVQPCDSTMEPFNETLSFRTRSEMDKTKTYRYIISWLFCYYDELEAVGVW